MRRTWSRIERWWWGARVADSHLKSVAWQKGRGRWSKKVKSYLAAAFFSRLLRLDYARTSSAEVITQFPQLWHSTRSNVWNKEKWKLSYILIVSRLGPLGSWHSDSTLTVNLEGTSRKLIRALTHPFSSSSMFFLSVASLFFSTSRDERLGTSFRMTYPAGVNDMYGTPS